MERYDKEYYKGRHKKRKAASILRDVLMHYKGKKDILLGIELMETIDYTIPARIMDYDAQEIKRQLRDISRRNHQLSKETRGFWAHNGEFLYGVRRGDCILPIYTVALYCGSAVYDGPWDILQLIDIDGLPEDYHDLLKSYPSRIYSLKDLPEEHFQTSLREIIAIFKRSANKAAMREYYLAHKERFRQLDNLSIDTIGALIGRQDLKLFQQEGGGLDMCKAFDDVYQEGRAEGRAEEREALLLHSLRSVMSHLKLTAEQAMEALDVPQEEKKKYLQLIQT